jgi:hypothetical protein
MNIEIYGDENFSKLKEIIKRNPKSPLTVNPGGNNRSQMSPNSRDTSEEVGSRINSPLDIL